MTIRVPSTEPQVDFAAALAKIRTEYLQDALAQTVKALSVPDIDRELAMHVPPHSLTALASHGLRGEMVFPIPLILRANPRLLGYYRLLYGYSQKEFYKTGTGLGRFKAMETRGLIRKKIATDIGELVSGLCEAGAFLIAGIGTAKISASLLDDLTLLTLGPQFRGGANVRIGEAGIRTVFNAIHEIVAASSVAAEDRRIQIQNATGRTATDRVCARP